MLERLFNDPTRKMDVKQGTLKGKVFRLPKEVDKPAYEVVGDIERYDTRYSMGRRMRLEPGTPEYEECYLKFPEKEKIDAKLRRHQASSKNKKSDKNAIQSQLGISTFTGALPLGQHDVEIRNIPLDGLHTLNRSDNSKLKVDPEEATRKIKGLALHLGAGRVRVTEIKQQWIYPNYPNGKPIDLNYKYVICMAFPQDQYMIDSQTDVSSAFEVGWKYTFASLVAVTVTNYIRRLGWPAEPLIMGRNPYLVVPTFIDAGIGEEGRCGFVVTKEFGNNWRPSAVVTDLPLIIDKPVDFGLQDFCRKCRLCAEKCPVGAIPMGDKVEVRGFKKWQIDAEKCLDYRLSTGKVCSSCQVFCPWNHENNLLHNVVREVASGVPIMRGALVKGDKILYPRRKPTPPPKWML